MNGELIVTDKSSLLGSFEHIQKSIEEVKTPEEAGELRHRVEAFGKYVRKKLPSIIKDRHERYKIAEEMAWKYLLAVHKHGKLWNDIPDEKKRPDGQPKNRSNLNGTIGWDDVGFANRRDALVSGRIGSLDIQDLMIYREAQQGRERLVSPNGA